MSDNEYPECATVNHTRAGNGNDASSGNVSTQECPDLSEGYDPAVFSLIEQHLRLPVDASQHPIYGESTSVFCRNGSISNTNDPYFDLATSTMAPESQQDDFRSVVLPVSTHFDACRSAGRFPVQCDTYEGSVHRRMKRIIRVLDHSIAEHCILNITAHHV